MPHAEISGWLEVGEEVKFTIPKECPKCAKKLSKVDSSYLCGIIFVYCSDSKCRFCEIFFA
jgi:hypothetical protein